MKRKDLLFIALALVAALALYGGNALLSGTTADTVVITVDGQPVIRAALSLPCTYAVPLPEGEENFVRIENGAVFMESANCRDQLCVKQGKSSTPGKQIVCLPHRVVVRLERSGDAPQDELDMIVR